ncbi:von Willebrand factor A domain-containing protein 5A isoform X1 [Pleuronectes platessa]|uniref:von Willebrand factor A domain-containing protein 5A isoform X1 n=1 Tax=Pleuronectes platessa TaxID=8262 RepID=UPI00232A60F6|nr:von Willebrand factor A domain-containing protein 5A isoform X1 [Pleuronectes platessa]XP_053278572.1 von Willebrand factor A domain-containing protein 5A isoform X1 [Pleuronectes platessa]
MEEENGEEQEKVVDLSVQSGVSSSYTAFIVVNEDNGEPIRGPLLCRPIPTTDVYLKGGVLDFSGDDSWSSIGKSVKKKVKSETFPCSDASIEPKEPPRDPLLQLVSLQKASGCWLLDPALAAAVGKTIEEVENTKPPSVNQEVWATILALLWLHGFKLHAKQKWELLAMKAVSGSVLRMHHVKLSVWKLETHCWVLW